MALANQTSSSTSRTSTLRKLAATGAGVACATALLLAPSDAHAEPSSATGKGIAGGALLGSELVLTIEAAAGVESGWAYLAGGVLGAAAGGAGGAAIEGSLDPRYSLYALVTGMALVIPVTVLTLNATAYRPPKGYQEDLPPEDNGPPADAPSRRAQLKLGAKDSLVFSLPRPRKLRLAPVGAPAYQAHVRLPGAGKAPAATSMVNLHASTVRMGMPMVEVRPRYTQLEIQRYGVSQSQEVRLPVFKASF